MKLYGASPSHFTRKVRVVLHELGVQFEFAALSRLLEATPEAFAENPLLQMPVLQDGAYRLIESDLICEYLIERYGKKQVRFYPIKGDGIVHRQRLAMINGGMGAGAKIMRAKRSAIPNFDDFAFFQQERASLLASLEWLDKDLGPRLSYAAEEFTLLEVSLMCFVEWAPFREMVPNLDAYPNLKRFQAHWQDHASFAATRPSIPVQP